MEHKEQSEREILLLLCQKLDLHLENHTKVHEVVDKRLDSHGSQLKSLWGGGGILGLAAAWLGTKGH